MSAQPLQARVLGVIRENQPLRRADLEGWLADVDSVLLDCCVNSLLRASKISLTGGYYDLVEQANPTKADKVARAGTSTAAFIGHATAPPTAAQEAAMSLTPKAAAATQVCTDCEGDPQPIDNFQIGRGNTRLKICRTCMGKRSSKAKQVNRLESTHTSAPPTGPQGPPATSLEHFAGESAQGTQPVDLAPANPEALLPVLAGKALSLQRGLLRGREAILDWIKDQEEGLAMALKALEEFDRVHELLQDLLPEEFTT